MPWGRLSAPRAIRQCGPAAGHNALGGFGINYPIGTWGKSYPNADGLTQPMHTDTTNGTARTYMPSALNTVDSGHNTYIWQNIGSTTSNVSYYTTWDIWAGGLTRLQHLDLRI